MKTTSKRTALRVAGLASALAFVILVAQAQSGPVQSVPAGRKMAEEAYKNIQVFKGVPADRLIPTMQFISASLGVDCEHCHVEHAFHKDDKKPKQTARKMIQMMFAINKDNFNGHREVTCYSCHHGAADRNPTQIDYADYRDTEGVKVPFRWTLARPGGRFTIQVDQVQQNVPIDDAKFAKPPEPLAPAQKPTSP